MSFVLNSLPKGSGATVSSGHKICIKVHIFSQWLTEVLSVCNGNIEERLSPLIENISKKAFWI